MRKDQLSTTRRATTFVPLALACTLSFTIPACAARDDSGAREEFLRYEIVATHPHDAGDFTQGLVVVEGRLAESTGRYGKSAVAIREIASGATVRRRALDAAQFGEGLALGAGRLLQLTWREGMALAYDLALNPVGAFRYTGEGWGLAFDGQHWLMSDGSDRIAFRRAGDFEVLREIRVTSRAGPVRRLNELEYAQGWLYANVWMTDRIAVIDPASGAVRAWLDLGPLRRRFARPPGWNEQEHVLNGIAYDAVSGHFYVTGKCWPALFELRVETPPRGSAP